MTSYPAVLAVQVSVENVTPRLTLLEKLHAFLLDLVLFSAPLLALACPPQAKGERLWDLRNVWIHLFGRGFPF